MLISLGTVLGEQTLLVFSSQPPSPGCSAVLPATVCEGRGGEKRFAMNQKTQLQFNLGVPPDHAKLATRFGPAHPSPVTIQKTVETIGMSCTPVRDFKAVSPTKLALAMKLAKRNVAVNSAPDMRVHEEEEESEETDESTEDEELESHSLRKDLKYQNVRGHFPESISRELLELDKRMEKLRRSKGPTVRIGNRPNVRTVGGGRERRVGGTGGGRPAVGVNRSNVQQAGGLRVDRPRARSAGGVGGALRTGGRPGVGVPGARGGVRAVDDRICWEDLDETQQREQQWREEQMTRNTRMMYDLSQQVRVQPPPPSCLKVFFMCNR